jgi:hypothetical protein
METDDTTKKETAQEEQSDEEEHPVIDPQGQPFKAQVTTQNLMQGVDLEGETPEEALIEEHPTPDHPSGRHTP